MNFVFQLMDIWVVSTFLVILNNALDIHINVCILTPGYTVIHFNSDSSHLELAQIPQIKGSVFHKIARSSDTATSLG